MAFYILLIGSYFGFEKYRSHSCCFIHLFLQKSVN